MKNVKNCLWIKCKDLLHTYNIAEFCGECKRSLHTETMRTDAQTFPQPVENPLASLARVILYHAVTKYIIARKASA